MGLALDTNLKFFTSVEKGLNLKVRKFFGLISIFVEVTEEKLVGGAFLGPPILNRVSDYLFYLTLAGNNEPFRVKPSISSG